MKETMKKAFIDLDKEEQWLNEQGQKGRMLISYDNGSYSFEDVSPAKYLYKIEIPKKQNQSDYFKFLGELGITVVAQSSGRVYLRKNEQDGPFDLYTDFDNQIKQSQKRNIVFNVIASSQLVLGIVLLINMVQYISEKNAPFWILLVFGIAFIISSLVFFLLGRSNRSKNEVLKSEKIMGE